MLVRISIEETNHAASMTTSTLKLPPWCSTCHLHAGFPHDLREQWCDNSLNGSGKRNQPSYNTGDNPKPEEDLKTVTVRLCVSCCHLKVATA